MSANPVSLETKNHLDIQELAHLKNQSLSNPQLTKHEVSQQFESILVQMLIKSMHEANHTLLGDQEIDSSDDLYQDLFDKQASLSISGNGLGFGKMKAYYLNQMERNQGGPTQEAPRVAPPLDSQKINIPIQEKKEGFNDELNFVTHLLDYAKKAALSLGVDPKLLLAQAALETGWGKHVIANNEGHSFNLFNIKADKHWDKKAVEMATLEEKDGIIFKETSAFRAYDSYAESFNDYVHFIKNNPRYQEALKVSSNSEKYMQLLQKAHYATDSDYSNKVMEIYQGKRLNNLLEQAQLV